MTNRQINMMEDEINIIQRKIDEAMKYMQAANCFGREEDAQRCWLERK